MVIPTSHPDCVLRPWREGDQGALVRHADNRKVWRNLTDAFPHPYTLADANHWLCVANSDPRSTHLAIELHGQAIGGVGAIAGAGTAAATADFGYWLGETFWGRGLATAAASAFKENLVESGRFARLQASVFAWNPASMRVLEKVGFVCEGVLRNSVSKDGELVDSFMYAYTDVSCALAARSRTFDPAAFAQRQLDAYNAHDLERFVAEYADDVVVFRLPGTEPVIQGKKNLADHYARHRFNLPGLHAKLVNRMVFGNKVIDLEYVTGVPGAPLEVAAIYEVTPGGISKVWLVSGA